MSALTRCASERRLSMTSNTERGGMGGAWYQTISRYHGWSTVLSLFFSFLFVVHVFIFPLFF